MSSTQLIIESMPSFTDTEKKIAQYLLDHRKELELLNMTDLSARIETSPAALVRFSKKLGYHGFIHLKIELIRDLGVNTIEEIATRPQGIDDVFYTYRNLQSKTLDLVIDNFDLEILEIMGEILLKAKTIYISSDTQTQSVAQDFIHNLKQLHPKVLSTDDNELMKSIVVTSDEKDVVLIISYEGTDKALREIQKIGFNNHTPVFSITQASANKIRKNATYHLDIPQLNVSKKNRAINARSALFNILDILYFMIEKKQLEFVI